MKQWDIDPDERPTTVDRIEQAIIGALVVASVLIALASLFRWVVPDAR